MEEINLVKEIERLEALYKQYGPEQAWLIKAGFHTIADRGSQNVLRSSAIIWKHTSVLVCDQL